MVVGSGLAALLLRRPESAHRVGSQGLLVGCVFGLLLGLVCLQLGEPRHLSMAGPLPEFPFSFRFDALAGLFLVLIFGIGGAAAVYGGPYATKGGHVHLGMLDFCLGSFLASMAMVVLADDVITFVAGWELMTVSAFLLIPFEHEKREVRKAAYLFLVASQLGTACVLAAFLLLAHHAGSLQFDAFRTAAPMSVGLRGLVFGLAFIGFGTKAGMIPFHVWLPQAHPVAPSHVSALMSGVMLKTAIYALVRFAFEFVQPVEAWWGTVVLLAGVVSALLGVIFALMEHDLKRLLAYHSVENIGIILMGLGAAMFFAGRGQQNLAGYALVACLFHTVNHAVFKALLFFGAGAVLYATDERNMEELGGLLRLMPYTGAAFLVGSMAISGLPPFNGFASEWMVYQGLWAISAGESGGAEFVGPLAAASLAAVGGLAASCFAKAFGITFLGLARSEQAGKAREVPAAMHVPMSLLAGLCLLLGLCPGLLLSALVRCLPFGAEVELLPGLFRVPAARVENGSMLPMLIPIVVAIALWALYASLRRRGLVPGSSRVYGPWNCGYPLVSPRAQYSATGFAQPFAYVVRKLFSRHKMLEIHAKRHYSPYLPEGLALQIHSRSPFDDWVYNPVQKLVIRLSTAVSRIQTGSLRLYLAFVLGTVILLLLVQP
jgi:hydrogenase-4 component B